MAVDIYLVFLLYMNHRSRTPGWDLELIVSFGDAYPQTPSQFGQGEFMNIEISHGIATRMK